MILSDHFETAPSTACGVPASGFLVVLIDDMSIRRIAVHADPRVLYS